MISFNGRGVGDAERYRRVEKGARAEALPGRKKLVNVGGGDVELGGFDKPVDIDGDGNEHLLVDAQAGLQADQVGLDGAERIESVLCGEAVEAGLNGGVGRLGGLHPVGRDVRQHADDAGRGRVGIGHKHDGAALLNGGELHLRELALGCRRALDLDTVNTIDGGAREEVRHGNIPCGRSSCGAQRPECFSSPMWHWANGERGWDIGPLPKTAPDNPEGGNRRGGGCGGGRSSGRGGAQTYTCWRTAWLCLAVRSPRTARDVEGRKV